MPEEFLSAAPAPPVAWRRRYRDGVVAMLPLLVGIVPFALVFGMSARALGWHPWETQALSMLLAAGGAQLAVLSLSAAGASGPVIVAVVALLNLRYALYGMALARWLPPDEPPPRPLLAAMLSDESFGLATREALAGRPSAAFLWGASITLYVVLALGTLAAGGAQLAVLSLSAAGASGPVIVAVVALLNLRYALYGMALARWLPPDEPPPRPLLAAMLSDESFGLATREALAGRPSAAFLWGASITLYVVLAVGTLAGTLLGAWLPDPRALGLDVVFPLVFLTLLLLTARGGRDWLVAGGSAVVAVGLRQVTDGGTALLGATVGTAAAAAFLAGRRPPPR